MNLIINILFRFIRFYIIFSISKISIVFFFFGTTSSLAIDILCIFILLDTKYGRFYDSCKTSLTNTPKHRMNEKNKQIVPSKNSFNFFYSWNIGENQYKYLQTWLLRLVIIETIQLKFKRNQLKWNLSPTC